MNLENKQFIIRRNNIKALIKDESLPFLIFAHGFGTSQTAWDYIFPDFTDRYNIILFDHIGSGESDMSLYTPTKYNSIFPFANDLIEICYCYGIKDAIYVGHSVGAMIGLLANHMETGLFKKFVFLGASPCYTNNENYFGGFTNQSLNELYDIMTLEFHSWVSGFSRDIIGERPRKRSILFKETLNQMRPDIALNYVKMIFKSDLRVYIPTCFVQTLLIQSENDSAVPDSVAQYLHENMPVNELIRIPVQGHTPHLTAPETIIALINQFLDR